jgi:KipI family sensor histidine kinase inhibitor
MPDMTTDVRFLPAGDTALVVEFGDRIDEALSERVLLLSARLRAEPPAGLVETVPTFRSLMVHYDPRETDGERLRAAIEAALRQAGSMAWRMRRWRLPACYEPDCAPDLAWVAEQTGLTAEDVVRRHAATQFRVYMIGFTPGFPYMGGLPPELNLPRRTDPRLRVPAGSIAIASGMTAIYPVESPGGWHLIGSTPVQLFDPQWERPSLLAPGDLVFFEPVGRAAYENIRAAVADRRYAPTAEEVAA